MQEALTPSLVGLRSRHWAPTLTALDMRAGQVGGGADLHGDVLAGDWLLGTEPPLSHRLGVMVTTMCRQHPRHTCQTWHQHQRMISSVISTTFD